MIVAADAEARREAMVSDWQRAFGRGEDALMVAKRNVEVEKLNALAREVMRARGELGEQEIEVGEARFAAGDQVITRVNDHNAQIYNRERWRVEPRSTPRARASSSTASTRRGGSSRCRLPERGTNPSDDAPALQHAYAVDDLLRAGHDGRPRLRRWPIPRWIGRSSTSPPRAAREET